MPDRRTLPPGIAKAPRRQICPLHLATAISEGADGGFAIDCDEIVESGAVLSSKRYGTNRLLLGAGSMGSSKLLVEAKGRKTLPKLNDFIGKDWGNDGDTFATRYTSWMVFRTSRG
jgi:cholesterol oxidase